jgi:hypothetical protein
VIAAVGCAPLDDDPSATGEAPGEVAMGETNGAAVAETGAGLVGCHSYEGAGIAANDVTATLYFSTTTSFAYLYAEPRVGASVVTGIASGQSIDMRIAPGQPSSNYLCSRNGYFWTQIGQHAGWVEGRLLTDYRRVDETLPQHAVDGCVRLDGRIFGSSVGIWITGATIRQSPSPDAPALGHASGGQSFDRDPEYRDGSFVRCPVNGYFLLHGYRDLGQPYVGWVSGAYFSGMWW